MDAFTKSIEAPMFFDTFNSFEMEVFNLFFLSSMITCTPVYCGISILAGCNGNGGQYASCVTSPVTCSFTTSTCGSRESFCAISDSCQSFSEPCSCSTLISEACDNIYVESQPDYFLVKQVAVDIPPGSANIYTVSLSEIEIHKNDIIGIQNSVNDQFLDCEIPSSSKWKQAVLMMAPQTGWLAEGDYLDTAKSNLANESLCNIQALYAEPINDLIPTALQYVSDPGTYEYRVVLPSRMMVESCSTDAEEPVGEVVWLYPDFMYMSGLIGTIGIEYNVPNTFAIKVSEGSHITSTWDLMEVTAPFEDTCPADVQAQNSTQLCSTTGIIATKPFSSIKYAFDQSTPSSAELTVKVENHFASKSVTVNVEKSVTIQGLTIIPDDGQTIIESNREIEFSVSYTKGYKPTYSYTVNSDLQSSNLDHFLYTFTTVGTYVIKVTASNFLGEESAEVSMVVKARAHITEFEFEYPNMDDLIYVAVINQAVLFKASSKITRRAAVNITWKFGDGATFETTKTSYGSTLRLNKDHPYQATGEYICMLIIDDGFDVVNFTANVSIRDTMPSVELSSSAMVGTVGIPLIFMAAIPSPGYYGSIKYRWLFGDDHTAIGNQSSIEHTYAVVGTYTVTLVVDNGVSSQNRDISVQVEEAITGLTLSYNGPLELGNIAEVTTSLIYGTNVEFVFSIDSVVTKTQILPVFSHSFSSTGKYNVSVTASNDVSNAAAFLFVYIIDASTLMLEGIDHDLCFPANESASLTAEVINLHPDTLTYEWTFGDGESLIDVASQTTSHTYVTAGTYTCSVSISTLTVNTEVCVQDKVAGAVLENDGPWELLESGHVTITFTASADMGTDVNYRWKYEGIEHASTASTFSISEISIGMYTVTVVIYNEVSTVEVTSDAAVQVGIAGVELACTSCTNITQIMYTPTGEAQTFEASAKVGSDVKFLWDFSDGSNLTTGNPVIHSFDKYGSYAIQLSAQNQLGSETKTLDIVAVQLITGVSLSADKLHVPVGGSVQFEAMPTKGSHLSFSWQACASCSVNVTTVSIFVFSGYTTPGEYEMKLILSNPLSSQQDSFPITAQEVVSVVNLTSDLVVPNYISINTVVSFSATADVSASFQWTIKKGGIQQEVLSGPNSEYSFAIIGVYEVAVTVSNDVSSKEETLEITVLELISSITIATNSTSPMATGAAVLITANVVSGSDIIYTWRLLQAPGGAETLSASTSSFNWIFTEVGSYELEVNASNALSTDTSQLQFELMDPVKGTVIRSTYNDSTVYATINDELFFSASTESGTSVQFKWHLDFSLQTDIKVTDSQDFIFTFDNEGEYTLTLCSSNDVSQEDVIVTIFIEIPLQSLDLLADVSIVKTGMLVTFEADHNAAATNVVYEWIFEGTPLTTLSNSTTFVFNLEGVKEIKLKAHNHVSSLEDTFEIRVQEPITNIKIPACDQVITAEEPVTIGATVATGTNVTYLWKLEANEDVTYEDRFDFTFVKPGPYGVTVYAQNDVDLLNQTCFLAVQGVIKNIDISVTGFLFTQTELQFITTGINLYGSTYDWNIQPTNTTYSQSTGELNHTFLTPDIYTVLLNVSNHISWEFKEIKLDLVDIKCQTPSIKHAGKSEVRVMRSRPVELEFQVDTLGCRINPLFYQWQIFNTSSCVGDPVTFPANVMFGSPTLLIPGWTMDYGNYCIKFITGYENFPFRILESIKLSVLESRLKAIIEGGNARLYPVLQPLILNGSESYDPDLNVGNSSNSQTYKWSCTSIDNGVSNSTNFELFILQLLKM